MSNSNIEEKIIVLEKKMTSIEEKLDNILNMLKNDIQKDCQKMSSHIDFIETVYENVKNPLGYLFDKISYLKGSDSRNYCIENTKY